MSSVAWSISTYLRQEFAARRAKNPYYSQRSFSQLLSIPSGRLSELMNGKRRLTIQLAEKIEKGLRPTPETLNLMATSLKIQKTKGFSTGKSDSSNEVDDYHLVANDHYSLIADWEHFAILSLMDLRDFKNDLSWISRRLGIHPNKVAIAIDRLIRAKLVRRRGTRLIKSDVSNRTTDQIPSAAIRASHQVRLSQASEALESVAVELRDVSTMSLAIDLAKINKAKALIRNFRREFAEIVEKGHRTEVYNLNIQFVPVTKQVSE
jgi:uncharacterized protein (TIGR02147 family)